MYYDHHHLSLKNAISRTASIAVVVVIVVIVIVAGYAALTLGQAPTTTTTPSTSTSTSQTTSTSSTQTTTSSSSTSTSTTSTQSIPQSLTYETLQTVQYLDPQVSYDIYGASVEQNIYEPLVWYNGTNGQQVIPWLAQSYSIAPDGRTANFTLRQGITFADGEQFNSTAVYFSYNRLLIFDGSSPTTHGTQASWILQQLENKSLSSSFSGPQSYSPEWASEVLAQDFTNHWSLHRNASCPEPKLCATLSSFKPVG